MSYIADRKDDVLPSVMALTEQAHVPHGKADDMETIFTSRDNLTAALREMFIVDGISQEDSVQVSEAITDLEVRASEDGEEGVKIYSSFLDVEVMLTEYADRARETVRAGAALLDSLRDDDWRARINRETLDVSDIKSCPLGQVYGDYHVGQTAILAEAEEREIELPEDWKNAFNGCGGDDPSGCCGESTLSMSLLTLAWLELLTV